MAGVSGEAVGLVDIAMNAKTTQNWILGGVFGLCVAALTIPIVLAGSADNRAENRMVMKFELMSQIAPYDVAHCLSRQSAGGFALGNERNGYSRRGNISELILGRKVDPDEPLINGFRRIEVRLRPQGDGTKFQLFSLPERPLRTSERAVLAKCLHVDPAIVAPGL